MGSLRAQDPQGEVGVSVAAAMEVAVRPVEEILTPLVGTGRVAAVLKGEAAGHPVGPGVLVALGVQGPVVPEVRERLARMKTTGISRFCTCW